MKRNRRFVVRALQAGTSILAASVLVVPAAAQDWGHSRKPVVHATRAGGPDAVSEDVGDVAVIVDNGLIVTQRNLPDLDGIKVRFEPVGDHLFTVSSAPGILDADYGPELTF